VRVGGEVGWGWGDGGGKGGWEGGDGGVGCWVGRMRVNGDVLCDREEGCDVFEVTRGKQIAIND